MPCLPLEREPNPNTEKKRSNRTDKIKHLPQSNDSPLPTHYHPAVEAILNLRDAPTRPVQGWNREGVGVKHQISYRAKPLALSPWLELKNKEDGVKINLNLAKRSNISSTQGWKRKTSRRRTAAAAATSGSMQHRSCLHSFSRVTAMIVARERGERPAQETNICQGFASMRCAAPSPPPALR